MIRTRKFEIIAFAVRRVRVVVLTFYQAVKELLIYGRGVCVPYYRYALDSWGSKQAALQ